MYLGELFEWIFLGNKPMITYTLFMNRNSNDLLTDLHVMVSRSPKLQLHQTPCHSQMIQRHSHQWQDPINICLQIESLGPFDPLSPIAPQFCIFPTPSLSTKNTTIVQQNVTTKKGLSKYKVIVHIEILGS